MQLYRLRINTVFCLLISLITIILLCGCSCPTRSKLSTLQNDQYEKLDSDTPKVHFLDVKNGDSIIIDMGDKEIIIDGGLNRKVLKRYIDRSGIIQGPIELLVLTHADPDHYRGLHYLVKHSNYSLSEFWEPGYGKGCKKWIPFLRYKPLLRMVNDKILNKDRFLRPLEDTYLPATHTPDLKPEPIWQINNTMPGIDITLLHLEKSPECVRPRSLNFICCNKCTYKINNASIVLKMKIQGVTFLFTGDVNGKLKCDERSEHPVDVEKLLLEVEEKYPGTLKADVLKVPHHGSETTSTKAFINAVDLKYVVFSSSESIGLPKSSVVKRYMNKERYVFRTDLTHGADNDHIICEMKGNGVVECYYLE